IAEQYALVVDERGRIQPGAKAIQQPPDLSCALSILENLSDPKEIGAPLGEKLKENFALGSRMLLEKELDNYVTGCKPFFAYVRRWLSPGQIRATQVWSEEQLTLL